MNQKCIVSIDKDKLGKDRSFVNSTIDPDATGWFWQEDGCEESQLIIEMNHKCIVLIDFAPKNLSVAAQSNSIGWKNTKPFSSHSVWTGQNLRGDR